MNISYIEEKLKDAKFTFLCKTRKELNEKIFFLVIQFRHLERPDQNFLILNSKYCPVLTTNSQGLSIFKTILQ